MEWKDCDILTIWSEMIVFWQLSGQISTLKESEKKKTSCKIWVKVPDNLEGVFIHSLWNICVNLVCTGRAGQQCK